MEEKEFHINVLELKAIYFVLQSLCGSIRDTYLKDFDTFIFISTRENLLLSSFLRISGSNYAYDMLNISILTIFENKYIKTKKQFCAYPLENSVKDVRLLIYYVTLVSY